MWRNLPGKISKMLNTNYREKYPHLDEIFDLEAEIMRDTAQKLHALIVSRLEEMGLTPVQRNIDWFRDMHDTSVEKMNGEPGQFKFIYSFVPNMDRIEQSSYNPWLADDKEKYLSVMRRVPAQVRNIQGSMTVKFNDKD